MNSLELSSSLRIAITSLHKLLRKQISITNTYSMTEIETIGHLSRNPFMLPTELAGLARVTTQTMSQILSKFEDQKVIKKTPSKEDKRKVFISLTPIGKKMVEKTRHEGDVWLNTMIDASLTDKEKEILIKALPVLNKLIETK